MNKFNRSITLLLSSLMFLTSMLVAQQAFSNTIYKCTNGEGSVFYKDKPCASKDKEKKVKIAVIPKSSLGNNHGLEKRLKPTTKQAAEKAKRDFERNENERKIRANEKMNEQMQIGIPQLDVPQPERK